MIDTEIHVHVPGLPLPLTAAVDSADAEAWRQLLGKIGAEVELSRPFERAKDTHPDQQALTK